jgi:putative transposase subfamily
LDTYPITARSLARPYHIKGDDFERAYKEFLSGYRTWKDLAHAERWLVFPRNTGPYLSIDETSLSDGELYTIVSNKDAHGKKGALVAIIKGTKAEDVTAALEHILWCLRAKVQEVTMDLSESMRAIVVASFPYATITIDRFHVQKDCYDAMQQLRVKHRREAQRELVEAREQHKLRNRRNMKRRKKGKRDPRGRKPERANRKFQPERLSNGDTKCELLARSRYLLMMSANRWSSSQKERAKLLFTLYPDLKTAYSLCHSLRMIFNSHNATPESAHESLSKWYVKVAEFDNDDFNTVSATIYEREKEIINYFINRHTNASAESLNAKIKHFRSQLRGVVDVKFFLYRLSLIFG